MLTNHFAKCDKCGKSHQFNDRPFDEILKVIRADGWRVNKAPVGWRHYCPECVARWNKTKLKPAVNYRKPAAPMWWQRD